MSWSFGLVEELETDGKILKLCEIYFEKMKPFGMTYVDNKQFKRDKKQILEDINQQIKYEIYFWIGKDNRIHMKRKPNKK